MEEKRGYSFTTISRSLAARRRGNRPSKEVSPDFINYTLIKKGGQILSGLIISETATRVRLRRNEGVEDAVLRRQIDELRASGKSLMPEGFEQALGLRDMADLLYFLRRPVPLSGQ